MTFQIPPLMPEGYFGWETVGYALVDGEEGINILKGVLHNLSSQENCHDHRYAQGVLVGVASALMAGGMNFEDTMRLCWQCAPNDIHPCRVPESWRSQFADKFQFRVGQRVCSKQGKMADSGIITKIQRGVIHIQWGEVDTGQVAENVAEQYLIVIKQENDDEKPSTTKG